MLLCCLVFFSQFCLARAFEKERLCRKSNASTKNSLTGPLDKLEDLSTMLLTNETNTSLSYRFQPATLCQDHFSVCWIHLLITIAECSTPNTAVLLFSLPYVWRLLLTCGVHCHRLWQKDENRKPTAAIKKYTKTTTHNCMGIAHTHTAAAKTKTDSQQQPTLRIPLLDFSCGGGKGIHEARIKDQPKQGSQTAGPQNS